MVRANLRCFEQTVSQRCFEQTVPKNLEDHLFGTFGYSPHEKSKTISWKNDRHVI